MNRHRMTSLALLAALVGGLMMVARLHADTPLVVINEILPGNASTNLDPDNKNFVPWVELHNSGGAAVALGGYRLTDDLSNPARWTIPAGTSIPAGGYLVLWLDGKNSGRHAPFALGMSGELGLFMPDGTPVDTLTFGPQLPDVAYGRGSGGWRHFDPPTPGAANGDGHADPTQAALPALSPPGGFYAGAQSVTITAAPGAAIRYTTDGSRPTAASPVYGEPIAVGGPTVVRARAFPADGLPSATATATYLVGVTGGIDVVSLATDPAYFFDNYIGIYVDGKAGIANPNCGKKVANWNRDWERPVSVEIYDADDGLILRQDGGVAIAGSCTRKDPQKQLQLFARPGYGDADFSAALFPDKPHLAALDRIILRAGGQDAANTLLRDALAQQLVAGRMDVDRQAYRPAVVFINGAFWGVYGVRERMDQYFVTSNYGLGLNEFDALEKKFQILNGSAADWTAVYNYLKTQNPADAAVYAQLQSEIDINEYINYQILEIYADNIDWPHNNIRFWSAHGPDGRWRWMAYDLDAAFGRATKGYNNNTFKFAAAKTGKRAHNALILRRLMLNPAFKAEFGQRFAAHLNTTYAPARVRGVIDDMAGTIAPQMPDHIARWGRPKSLAYWQSEVGRLRTFADRRPEFLWNHLNTFLGKPGMTTLTVAHDEAQGSVRVAGVDVPGNYTGTHFRNLPVRLEAVPADGFVFVQWAETNETDPATTVVLSGAATRTAVFAPAP